MEKWDGAYEKDFYWLTPAGSEERIMCWPNAGYMNATDGSGRMWQPEDGVQVERIQEDEHPARQHDKAREERDKKPVVDTRSRPRSRPFGLSALMAAASLSTEFRPSFETASDLLDAPLPEPVYDSRKGPSWQDGTSTGRTSCRVTQSPRTATSMLPAMVDGKKTVYWSRADGRAGICAHFSGLAGGFSECSACGVRQPKEKRVT